MNCEGMNFEEKYSTLMEVATQLNKVNEDSQEQGYNARKVSCSCVFSAFILKLVLFGGFLNKNRCISVSLVSEEVKKALNFDNFDNSHNSFTTRIFH